MHCSILRFSKCKDARIYFEWDTTKRLKNKNPNYLNWLEQTHNFLLYWAQYLASWHLLFGLEQEPEAAADGGTCQFVTQKDPD